MDASPVQRMALVNYHPGRAEKGYPNSCLFYGLDKEPGPFFFEEVPWWQEGSATLLPAHALQRLCNEGDDNDDNCHLLGIYYMPKTMVSVLHTLPDLILTTNVEGGYYY